MNEFLSNVVNIIGNYSVRKITDELKKHLSLLEININFNHLIFVNWGVWNWWKYVFKVKTKSEGYYHWIEFPFHASESGK